MELKHIEGCYLPYGFFTVKEKIEHFEVRDEDVWVTSYPKSGTTWCQELVWLVLNDLDYEGAKIDLEIRSPFIEVEGIIKMMKNVIKEIPDLHNIKLLNDQPSTRCIKTHLPWNLLPRQIIDGSKTPKIIHVMRNPRQVGPSFFHHLTEMFPVYKLDINEFIDLYIKGEVLFGDYFNTVLSYWNKRQSPNLLLLTYEEMKADLRSVIARVCEFLGKSYTEDEIEELVKHLSFEKMKINPAVNKEIAIVKGFQFMREGKVDGYKEELTQENIRKLDEWVAEKIEGTDLPYKS